MKPEVVHTILQQRVLHLNPNGFRHSFPLFGVSINQSQDFPSTMLGTSDPFPQHPIVPVPSKSQSSSISVKSKHPILFQHLDCQAASQLQTAS